MAAYSTNPDRGKGAGRLLYSLIRARGSLPDAREIATDRWGELSATATILRAAVTSGSLQPTDSWAGGALSEMRTLTNELMQLVAPRSILGQAQLRQVPLNTRMLVETSTVQAWWVGGGAPKPVSSANFSVTELDVLKLSALTLVTRELIDRSAHDVEGMLANQLAAAIARATDEQFLSTDPGISGIQPPGILASATAIPSVGTALDDLGALFAAFTGDLSTSVLVMRPEVAVALALQGAAAGSTFADTGARGGSLFGLPTIVSSHVSSDSSGSDIVLFDSQGILLGQGPLKIDVFTQGSIECLDNPTNNSATATATSMVSLYQTNSAAMRAERSINWSVARPGSVAYVTGASYSGT